MKNEQILEIVEWFTTTADSKLAAARERMAKVVAADSNQFADWNEFDNLMAAQGEVKVYAALNQIVSFGKDNDWDNDKVAEEIQKYIMQQLSFWHTGQGSSPAGNAIRDFDHQAWVQAAKNLGMVKF